MAERRDGNGDNNEDKATPGVMGGAAAVGATVGAIVAGPITALALGVGAAGLTLSDGKAGEVARSTGKAGVAVIEKGKDMYTRYEVGDKVKGAVQTTYTKAREIDEKHGVVDKAKTGASKAWTSLREFDREHRLTSRASDAFIRTMDGTTNAVKGMSDESRPHDSSSSSSSSSSRK